MDFSRGRRSSEEGKSLTESFSDGTSKFFTSMIAKKNGLFSDITSRIDSITKNPTSSGSETSSPASSPPPRTPPPRPRPPNIARTYSRKSKDGENVVTKMSDYKPVSKTASSSGYSENNSTDEQYVLNGMNVSFDEPIYNKRENPIGRSCSDSDSKIPTHKEQQQQQPHVNSVQQQSPLVQSGIIKENGFKEQSPVPDERDNTTADGRMDKRAPKLQTNRRSSTVDELLFDDYVPPSDLGPDEDPVFRSDKPLPDNLISFDPTDDKHDETGEKNGTPGETAHSSGSSEDNDSTRNYYATASMDSSDAEFGGIQLQRSQSMGSDKSWSSTYSIDSQPDEITLECMSFMKQFVDKIFNTEGGISQMEKAKYGELCQQVPGRLWFSRYVNSQRVNSKRVDEQTFFQLIQYFAVCLFECNEAEDYSPAKTLMNMCFTFFYESHGHPTDMDVKHFLYNYLRDQPIWQSLRFWNAAFFDAVQGERSRKPMATFDTGSDARNDDRHFQENITFGQLGTFTCNMRAFGLSRELCLEFLRKQATIANLSDEQILMLRNNIDKYKEP
ncbi:uncharacterized protein LOC121388460 [Gigantopelta aegis]|uniref:uncharacterized protein LOC121388460 n=1 Tax=Gigantopelta aegis TaxID=1735272 RepID=UPI001B88ABFC|nr:uncharacterized protein LOC121388460 [Gigantopelta aegis]